MAAAVLAKDRGLTVLSTTRSPERAAALAADRRRPRRSSTTAQVAAEVRSDRPGRRRRRARARRHADAARHAAGDARPRRRLLHRACSATSGPCRDFYPIDYLPSGVRLTAYGGDAADLPADVLQSFLDDVAAGRLHRPDPPHLHPRRDRRRPTRTWKPATPPASSSYFRRDGAYTSEGTTMNRARPETSEDRPLAGTIALVAGATRGAGRGIAVALGEAGATVYCTGRTHRRAALRVRPARDDRGDRRARRRRRRARASRSPVDHLEPDAGRGARRAHRRRAGPPRRPRQRHLGRRAAAVAVGHADLGARPRRTACACCAWRSTRTSITSHYALPLLIRTPGRPASSR